jgi:hypothetical protein
LHTGPALDGFRALDDDLRARRGRVNDACGVRGSAARWVDLLAVDALVDNDGIPRLREFRRRRDGFGCMTKKGVIRRRLPRSLRSDRRSDSTEKR